MPVPDFQSLMKPVLEALSDGAATRISEVRARVAAAEALTPGDLREMLPSGRQSVFANRVGWAVTHMEHAGLLERVRRGTYRLTEDGGKLLAQAPVRIDMKTLHAVPVYAEWIGRARESAPGNDTGVIERRTLDLNKLSALGKDTVPVQAEESADTPEEALERAARQLRVELEAEVLKRVLEAPPAFLERVVVDLLIAMGYGGGDAAMGQVTGRSGDGGIDGTIREDALGLDEVYIQAKKYTEGTVGESALRNFAGAIDAAGTTKGVFVTTASFTRAAKEYVARSPKRIVLIDGEELARLMVAHNIGVRIRDRHAIKRIDEDYFDQEAV